MNAEDLVAAIFPDQIACAENLVGEREIPDHPLVRQTIADCLEEAMDIAGLERLLRRLEAGEIEVVTRDLTEPSPLAVEVLSARPYAYLDDAPLEERRTQAVMGRRWLAPEEAADHRPARCRGDRRACAPRPGPRRAMPTSCTTRWSGSASSAADEVAARPGWSDWLAALARDKRAARLRLPQASLWVAAERLPHVEALWPDAQLEPAIAAPDGLRAGGRCHAPRPRWSRCCAAGSRGWAR